MIVVDDGSSDLSRERLQKEGIPFLEATSNHGRGSVRKRAMDWAPASSIVLCCDATNRLSPDFLERAIPLFQDAKVAAVYGRLQDPDPNTVTDRWRARHLFKSASTTIVPKAQDLITWGTLIRKSAHDQVGGFDPKLKHSEDHDLGKKLIDAGYHMIYDPSLGIFPQISNPPAKVIERYLRWNFGPGNNPKLSARLRFISYAIKVLLPRDLKDKDLSSALLTLACMAVALWIQL